VDHPLIGGNFVFVLPPIAKAVEPGKAAAQQPASAIEASRPKQLSLTGESTEVEVKTYSEDTQAVCAPRQTSHWERDLSSLKEMLDEIIFHDRLNLLSYTILQGSIKTLLHKFLLLRFTEPLLAILERPFDTKAAYLDTFSFRRKSERPYNKKLSLEIRSRLLFLKKIKEGAAVQSDVMIRDFTKIYLGRYQPKEQESGIIQYIKEAYSRSAQDPSFKSCELPFEAWLSYFAVYLQEIYLMKYEAVLGAYREKAHRRLDLIFGQLNENSHKKTIKSLASICSEQRGFPLTNRELQIVDGEFKALLKKDLAVTRKYLELDPEIPVQAQPLKDQPSKEEERKRASDGPQSQGPAPKPSKKFQGC
jgi:hypothetical protein